MDKLLDEDEDYDVVTSLLESLNKQDIVSLGEALGLKRVTVNEMTNMPEDMVDAWFKMRDDVLVASGEPTWASLTQALEHVGQRNLADKIKKDIESMGIPKVCSELPSVFTDVSTTGQSLGQVTIGDDLTDSSSVHRTQSDDVPPSGASIHRIEGDNMISWIKSVIKHQGKKGHTPAKVRGKHQAQLRLHDEYDKITEIIPKKSEQQPFSYRGFYAMNSEKHGVALIINNTEFESHKERTGSDRDEQNLTETWQFLGYHVVTLRNCTRNEMVMTFDNIDGMLKGAKEVANDSFVCCILSHGLEGVVYGSDSQPLEYRRIQTYLAKSEILQSRPKMFFVQACLGENKGPLPIEDRLKNIETDDDRISELTDFYLSHASVDGDRSYRDIYTGSWYITELCQTLCEFSMVMDLDEIQKEVNERVVKKYTHLGHKQQPRGIDQLRKKVYFFSNNN